MGNNNAWMPQLLEDGAQAGLDLAQALEKARKAAKALASTSTRVKRVLAGFDQINRLGETKKSAGTKKNSEKKQETEKVETVTQQDVKNAMTLKQVFDELDDRVLAASVGLSPGLANAILLARQAGEQLYATWQGQMLPVGQWLQQHLIPALGQQLGDGFQSAWQAVSLFGSQFYNCWQQMGDISNQAAVHIGKSLQNLGSGFDGLVQKVFGDSLQLGNTTEAMTQGIAEAGRETVAALRIMQDGWSESLGNMGAGVNTLTTGTMGALQSVAAYIQGDFTQSWKSGMEGLKNPAKGAFNGVIGFVNKFLDGMGSACNGMVGIVNDMKIKIPDWVPGIGGKQYGFSLKSVVAPEIPYLAKGAVLPANQPFLAVVGDQKHGTNVEAPLATIQEAVAAVMADHTAGNMAGHEATVAVLHQILEAVLGIDVGEAVIARAAQSYQRKEAIMKGGGF